MIPAKLTARDPKVIRRRFHEPPTIAATMKASTTDVTAIVKGVKRAFSIQLLNSMAAYCFSSTANQNTGSEKNTKAIKVMA